MCTLYSNIEIDLIKTFSIFNLPGQTIERWRVAHENTTEDSTIQVLRLMQ
jgi:hypothetical protein